MCTLNTLNSDINKVVMEYNWLYKASTLIVCWRQGFDSDPFSLSHPLLAVRPVWELISHRDENSIVSFCRTESNEARGRFATDLDL